jgi:hypothetical protein
MLNRDSIRAALLNLKAGEWVEVRSREEIFATLDVSGRLENLPFMPEMLEYCGKRLRVSKRSDKTCDNIEPWSIRRMKNSIHLEGIRCDGSEHGGCQAGCLIWWHEAWLKRAKNDVVPASSLVPSVQSSAREKDFCTVESLLAASQHTNPEGETVYSCQATDVLKFTSYMWAWDPRQYIRDIRSGNLRTGLAGNSRGQRAMDTVLAVIQVLRSVIISLYNEAQTRRNRLPFPPVEGMAARTPLEILDLQPGELVEVRSREEILATLDKQNRNRGLLFDAELLYYCSGIYRVLRRVTKIIDEKTGKMMEMKNPCIVLDGVACRSDYHRLCPKAIYHYWRENWLKRATDASVPHSSKQIAEPCAKN